MNPSPSILDEIADCVAKSGAFPGVIEPIHVDGGHGPSRTTGLRVYDGKGNVHLIAVTATVSSST